MAELPHGKESLVADFTTVKNAADLLRELKKIPNGEQPFMAAAEPYSNDITYRDSSFLGGLLDNMFQYAEASSMRQGSPAEKAAFLDKLISETLYDDGGATAFIAAVRRAIVAEFPEFADTSEASAAAVETPAAIPENIASVPLMITREMRQALADLGYPTKVVDGMIPERAQEVIGVGKMYLKPKVAGGTKPAGSAPAPTPAPAPTVSPAPVVSAHPAPADLAKLMAKKAEVVPVAATSAASAEATATSLNITSVLDNPEFRAFFAKSDKAEELLQNQDLAAIETCHRAFVIKDRLATDLYELANGAIKGDFLLDFENPASNLPKNQRAEFQRYVDKEALERPEQLLNLAFQLETRQVLEKNIATAKAEIAQLGVKEFFDEAEREALEMKTHLERAHESTRRDRIAGYIPHDLHLGFLKMTYKVREWVGWKGQTEGSIQDDFRKKREALLNGRAEADLMAWEKLAFNKLVQSEAAKLGEMKRHNALGERMVEVSQQGLSRAKLAGDGVNLGLGSLLTYSPFWGHHPEIVRELENVNGRLAEIQKRKQTIEQVEHNLVSLTQSFEAIRTSAYKELPPTIALVKYAQAQVRNTLTSFTADTAAEDLQRIYNYGLLLSEDRAMFSVFDTFSEAGETPGAALDKIHEAIVAQWGKRVFEVFSKTAINKKGSAAEIEKTIKAILDQESIGGVDWPATKVAVVKNLVDEAFKKIDPTKGDGKERRLLLMGVMINCGLLKKGEKITT